jgi:AcrR family transcriptional regulator
MSPRPRQEDRHPDLQNAIKETAWKQIAESGAAALGLRSIARDLNITAPSIYNYFPRRDDLVTALIVDAYTSLGESQRKSAEAISADHLEARFFALGLDYRAWALAQAQRYQLIFGTPIPGYHAPEDITMPAAALALLPLIENLQALQQARKLRLERLPTGSPALDSMLKAWQDFVSQSGSRVHPEVLYLSYVVWSRVHGLVSLEIGHQTPSFITDPGEIYRREIESMKQQYLTIEP